MSKDISERGQGMADRIKNYYNDIEELLDDPPEAIDYDCEIEKHITQIEFFMHERLIHLIVMVTFAIIAVICILYTLQFFSIPLVLLDVLLLSLLIPYIKHYYLLENTVQKMYEQYDDMLSRKENR